MLTITTKNEEETMNFAKKLTEFLKPGMVLILEGDLGAGKTTFTKGIGEGLGIQRLIKSPTYTIIREYMDGEYPLYHIDLYRLEESEVEDLGLEEYFEGEGLTVIEWPSVAPEELPKERLELRLNVDPSSPEQREIELTSAGEKYDNVLEQIRKAQ